jgi:hypothetical protein
VATSTYMNNRKKWGRPQALLFSDNPGTLESGFYIPTGDEFEDFIILSDHNRSGISISNQRIENRQRMVNGTMRSYHIADKLNISTSWQRLPSRSFSSDPFFDEGKFEQEKVFLNNKFLGFNPEEHTADGGAGGADILEWYQNHPGPFWLFLSYDKFGEDNLNRYTQVLHVYFSSFDYDVEKRGQSWGSGTAMGYDMWNLVISLEEV